jgi:hypothetical protein
MKSSGGRAALVALGMPVAAFGVFGLGFVVPAVLSGCEGRPRQGMELGVVESAQQEIHGSGTCIEDMWAHAGNSQEVTCKANDVQVAQATNICILNGDGTETCQVEDDGGTNDLTCREGDMVTFRADFEVVLTSQERFDIGVYFGTDGDPNDDGALTGQCSGNIITGTNAPTTFTNEPVTGDICGDIDDANNPQIMTLTITTLCETEDVGTERRLSLPYCTSWRQPGSNGLCNEIEDAYPGSPSKCKCNPGFTVDITVEPLAAAVTKTATEACVTYDVQVTNSTESRDMELTALSDNPFGDITDTDNPSLCFTTCGQPAGDGGTGGAGELPALLEIGESYSCQFGAKVASLDDPQTDTVTATLVNPDDENDTLTETAEETVLIDLDVDPPADAGTP